MGRWRRRCGRSARGAAAGRLGAPAAIPAAAARRARCGWGRWRSARGRSRAARRSRRNGNTRRGPRRLIISRSFDEVIISDPAGGILFRDRFFARGDRRWRRIGVHKAVFAWIVHDGRIVAEGNDARPAAAFEGRARCAHRGSCSHKAACQRVMCRRLYGFPFLSACCGQNRRRWIPGGLGGKDAVLQIQRSLAVLVERMHGDDTELAVLANEYSRRRTIERVRWMDDGRKTLSWVTPISSVIRWRRIEPAATRGVKEPAAIVVRSPAPRLVAGKSPAEAGIPHPLAHGERRPAEACAEGPPSVAIASTRRPGAVGVEIGVAW